MSANEKMPQGEDYVSLNPTHFNKLDFDIDAKQWLNSLQPCEISESELCLILSNVTKLDYDNPIEVTDIISDNNGVISFKEHPKQVEEIEAVDMLLNTFGQYCTLNGIKLTDSNKVGQAVIDFLKSDIYEIFKNQK